jgi:hypothetical protein
MPIDTAVAATTSETASATVANSAMPQRRLAKVAWAMGDAKPTFKVSSVMANSVMAMASLAIRVEHPNQSLHCRKKSHENLGRAFEEQRRLCDF